VTLRVHHERGEWFASITLDAAKGRYLITRSSSRGTALSELERLLVAELAEVRVRLAELRAGGRRTTLR
jgi:succinyl-CoA synthetase beta subunit